jgi:hypothetical protein
MRIYKYIVPMPNKQYESEIQIPTKATILSAGIQNDQIVVWANIPNSAINPQGCVISTSPRKLYVVNTGENYAKELYLKYIKFIGTVTSSNAIVWHIFDADKIDW